MTREDAKAQAKKMLPEYLRMKGINIRQNFRCLSPDHQDNNPSMSYDRETDHVHCFACGANYDIFDLVGIDYGLSEDRDKFNKAYELLGLPIDSPQQGGRNTGSRAGQNTKQGQALKPAQPQGQYRNPAETEQNTILHTQKQQHNTDTQYTIQNIEPAPHIDLTAELEEAQKKLKASSADVAKFGVWFTQVQNDFNRMMEALREVNERDPETGEKLKRGAVTLLKNQVARLEPEVPDV